MCVFVNGQVHLSTFLIAGVYNVANIVEFLSSATKKLSLVIFCGRDKMLISFKHRLYRYRDSILYNTLSLGLWLNYCISWFMRIYSYVYSITRKNFTYYERHSAQWLIERVISHLIAFYSLAEINYKIFKECRHTSFLALSRHTRIIIVAQKSENVTFVVRKEGRSVVRATYVFRYLHANRVFFFQRCNESSCCYFCVKVV